MTIPRPNLTVNISKIKPQAYDVIADTYVPVGLRHDSPHTSKSTATEV